MLLNLVDGCIGRDMSGFIVVSLGVSLWVGVGVCVCMCVGEEPF